MSTGHRQRRLPAISRALQGGKRRIRPADSDATTQSADSTTETGGCKRKKKRSPQQKISSVFRAVAAASSSSSSPLRINGHDIVGHQAHPHPLHPPPSPRRSPPAATSSSFLSKKAPGPTNARILYSTRGRSSRRSQRCTWGSGGRARLGGGWSHVVLLAEGGGRGGDYLVVRHGLGSFTSA